MPHVLLQNLFPNLHRINLDDPKACCCKLVQILGPGPFSQWQVRFPSFAEALLVNKPSQSMHPPTPAFNVPLKPACPQFANPYKEMERDINDGDDDDGDDDDGIVGDDNGVLVDPVAMQEMKILMGEAKEKPNSPAHLHILELLRSLEKVGNSSLTPEQRVL